MPDSIDIVIAFWKNKWLSLAIFFITISIGYAYIAPNDFSTKPLIYKGFVNVLIEENPIYIHKDVVIYLNHSLATSYNYEKWRKKNIEYNLNQGSATSLVISEANHTVSLLFNTEEEVNAATSYLDYTANVLSNKILSMMRNYLDVMIEKVANEYNSIENDIINRKIEIASAKNQLDYINNKLSEEKRSNEVVILHILNLRTKIYENESRIQNLIDRKTRDRSEPLGLGFNLLETNLKLKNVNTELLDLIKKYSSAEYADMEDLNITILNIQQQLQEAPTYEESSNIERIKEQLEYLEDNRVIKLGDINVHQSTKDSRFTGTNRDTSNKRIGLYILFIMLGLILSLLTVLFKEEYQKRKRNNLLKD